MTAQTQRRVRQFHNYLGVFFAPALLLFSVSGVLQTFRLPDAAPPGSWMTWLAAVHKDQAPPRMDRRKPTGAAHRPEQEHHDDPPPGAAKGPNPLPLKIFVTLMSLGLIGSTLLGLTIAYTNRARRRTTTLLLIAGAVLPCVLLWI